MAAWLGNLLSPPIFATFRHFLLFALEDDDEKDAVSYIVNSA